MIENPKMVYRVWRRDTSYDQREGEYVTSTLVATCNTAEEVVTALEFDKWMKVTYEVEVPPKYTSAGNSHR